MESDDEVNNINILIQKNHKQLGIGAVVFVYLN